MLRETIEVEPSNLQAYGMLQAVLAQRKLDAAKAEFQTLAARQPKSVPVHTMIATTAGAGQERRSAEAVRAGHGH